MGNNVKTTIPIDDLILNFQVRGGEIEQCPYGNSVRDDDGETWQETNRKTYLIRQEKESVK